MKKAIFKAKSHIETQKKLYICLIGLAILAIMTGIIFIFLTSEENIIHIKENITLFFTNLPEQDKWELFINSIINNFTYILVIWILGISIIGLPIILIIFLFKFFLFGFSLSSIICTYQWNGIIKAFFHLFPHQILFLIVLILLSFYAISFCIKLFRYLFFKRLINFREVMRKYLKVLVISVVTNLFIVLYEVYISTYLLNLLN